MINHSLEALLRPPLEWYSALISSVSAGILYAYNDQFLLPANIASSGAVGLLLFSAVRFMQGCRVWRYQRNLKRLPKYAMTSQQLPVDKKHLFLGRGFLWLPTHTQRLRDLDLPYNLHYREPSKLYQWVREHEIRWINSGLLKSLVPWLRSDSWLNPFRPLPDIGGQPCLHGVSTEEQDIWISLTERAGHTVVIGTTGVGKTRFAEILIGQDIRRGDVVIVLDPKGDADLLKRILIEAKACGREEDVLIMHLGFPEFSARYNAIGDFTKITQVATRVANALPSSGEASTFKEFAWKYVNLVTKALVAIGLKPSYQLINLYINNMENLFVRFCENYFPKRDSDFRVWINTFIIENTRTNEAGITIKPTQRDALFAYVQNYLKGYADDPLGHPDNDLIRSLLAANKLDKTYYDKITASVGPLLEKLTTGEIAELLSPDYNNIADNRPIFDWSQVIRQKKIVYIGMDALTDSTVSSAVGNAMLADLVSVAGHLYKFGMYHGYETLVGLQKQKAPIVRLHVDEFNEVIGEEFIPILNKARGAGFNVTAYTQTWSDVEARLSSTAKAGQVAGNFNTLVMFRTKEAKTVDMVLGQLPKVPILRVLPASSSSDSPQGDAGVFYQSSNEDRLSHTEVRLIEQNDVINLPKGQAFCLLEGGKLYKVRMPLPADDDSHLPNDVTQLIQAMRTRHEST